MSELRECPRCRVRYVEGEGFCPADGARLVVLPAVAAGSGGPQGAAAASASALGSGRAEGAGAPAAAGQTDSRLGLLIAGRFLVQEQIAAGRFAVVYKGIHRVLGRAFAIKILRREHVPDKRVLSRFYREAKAASAVDHPNIVSVHDYGQTPQAEPFLVMEYVAGLTLSQRRREHSAKVLGLTHALDIALQVAQALSHAHQRGVFHRDIQPDNIFLTARDGQLDFVKLLGFGVARLASEPSVTQMGEVLGTPEFVAPEAWSWGDADKAAGPTDVYALGMVVHDMVAGGPPFCGERGEVMLAHLSSIPPTLGQRRPDLRVPATLDGLVGRMLDKDPAARPTAAECAAQIEEIKTQLPPQSMRSLLLRETLILNDPRRTQALESRSRPTLIVDRSVLQTVLSFGSKLLQAEARLQAEAEPAQVARSGPPAPAAAGTAATIVTPPKGPVTLPGAMVLGQIDSLEAELDRLGRRLWEHSEALLDRLPGGGPREGQALRREIESSEREEEDLGVQLAVQTDHLRQLERGLQRRQAGLRLRSLELSERLRGLGHGPGAGPEAGAAGLEVAATGLQGFLDHADDELVDVRQTAQLSPEAWELQQEILECERQAVELEEAERAPIEALEREVHLGRAHLSELQSRVHGRRIQLARLAIAGAGRFPQERRGLEQLVAQIEGVAAALQRVLQQA